MPHEVIMPALGMAQESGQIVAWLKKPGDAVKSGDALMEVETDKATMEVEAAADGYLTDVRAAAGDSVPVGDVIAMISETADDARKADAAAPAPATPAETAAPPDQDTPPEGKPVIMPALGMSQDTGKIVAWCKAPGDAVSADDVLLEVETDKATMEVHAGHDGWLAETRGADGDDIPVGEVIAIISAEKPDSPRKLGRAEAAGAGNKTTAQEPAEATTDAEAGTAAPARPDGRKAAPQATAPPKPMPAATGQRPAGRILASPKARRLAAERGLDLGRLLEAGYEPPFHVADLETLAALPAPRAASAAGAATAMARIEAEVPARGLADFCDWAAGEGAVVTPARVIVAFAAAALRQASDADGSIHVALARPGQSTGALADPDLAPLTTEIEASDAAPDLVLFDLTGSRLTRLSPGPSRAPTLTVSRSGEAYRLALDYETAALDPDAAIVLMDGLAERVDEPLRHLL